MKVTEFLDKNNVIIHKEKSLILLDILGPRRKNKIQKIIEQIKTSSHGNRVPMFIKREMNIIVNNIPFIFFDNRGIINKFDIFNSKDGIITNILYNLSSASRKENIIIIKLYQNKKTKIKKEDQLFIDNFTIRCNSDNFNIQAIRNSFDQIIKKLTFLYEALLRQSIFKIEKQENSIFLLKKDKKYMIGYVYKNKIHILDIIIRNNKPLLIGSYSYFQHNILSITDPYLKNIYLFNIKKISKELIIFILKRNFKLDDHLIDNINIEKIYKKDILESKYIKNLA